MSSRIPAIDPKAIHPAGGAGTSDRSIPSGYIDVEAHAPHRDDLESTNREPGNAPHSGDKKPIGRFLLIATLAGIASGALTMLWTPTERSVSAVFQIRPESREVFDACRRDFGQFASEAALDIAGHNEPWPWVVVHRTDQRQLVLRVTPAETTEVAALAEVVATKLRALIERASPAESIPVEDQGPEPVELLEDAGNQLEALMNQLAGFAASFNSQTGPVIQFDERELDAIDRTTQDIEASIERHRQARLAFHEASGTPVPMSAVVEEATRRRILGADPELRNDHQELRIRAANLRDALNRVMNEANAPIAQYGGALATLRAAATLDSNKDMSQDARRVVERCAIAADLLRTAYDEFGRAWSLAGEKANIATDSENFNDLIAAHDDAVAAYESWLTDCNRAIDRINEPIRAAGSAWPDDPIIDQIRRAYHEFWAARQILAERIEKIRGAHNVVIDAAGSTLRLIYRRYERRLAAINNVLEGEALRESRRKHLDQIDATRQTLVDESIQLAAALDDAVNLTRRQHAAIREFTSQNNAPGRLINAASSVSRFQSALSDVTERIRSIDVSEKPVLQRGETVALRIEEHFRNKNGRSASAWGVGVGLIVGLITLWTQAGLHGHRRSSRIIQ
jgi:hypothetical protein